MDMFGNLGRALRLLRDLQGWSQADFARRASIGKSQLSKYESGKELPKLDTLEKLLLTLGVSPLDFFQTVRFFDEREEWLRGGAISARDISAGRGLLSPEAREAFERLGSDLLKLQANVIHQILETRFASSSGSQRDEPGEPR